MFDFILHAKQTLAVTTAKLRDVLVLVANRKHEIRHCVDHLHCDGKRCMPRAQEDVKQKRALYVRHTFLPAYARPRCIECAVPFMSVVISAAVCATLAVLLWKQRERGNRWNCARFSRHGGAVDSNSVNAERKIRPTSSRNSGCSRDVGCSYDPAPDLRRLP